MEKLVAPPTVNKKYEKVAPEGGWGYMVAVAVFVSISLHAAPLSSFGVLYVDFLNSVGASTAAITTLNGLYSTFNAMSGLFAHFLHKKFSCRQVAFAGAILYVIGHFSTIFVQSIGALFFTYAILPGIGFGLMIPAILTSFNGYFVRKRTVAMLTLKPFVGVAFMCYPLLVYTLLNTYGFRGALTVLAAISTHMIFAALTLQPSEKHRIRVEIVTEEETVAPLLSVENKTNTHVLRISQESGINNDPKSDLKQPKINDEIKTENIEDSNHKQNILQSIIGFFDLKLLKDFSYVNIVIGLCFVEYSVVAFYILVPLYLLSNGWTKQEASVCMSIMGGCDIISKIFLAISSRYYPIKSRYIFLAGSIFSAIARTCFLFVGNHTAVIFVCGFLGFFKSWIFAVPVLVIAEHVPKERFPSAYGLFMFFQGNSYMIFGPIVGYVRDVSGSYTICFHVLTAFLMVCIIPWIIEIILTRKKRRNKH